MIQFLARATPLRRILPLVVAMPLVVSFGVVEGLWSDRWGLSHDAELAAARLQEVPVTVGDWDAQARILDDRQVARAEINGYLLRQYVHRPTGAAVTVLIVCGRPGPVAVHTPDVCYGGAGFGLVGSKEHHALEGESLGRPADFWVAQFRKVVAADPEQLRIFWSWTATGEWAAPNNPRFAFARSSVLFKLYIVRRMASLDEPLEKDPSPDFLRLFLPEVNKCLFETSS